MIKPTSKKKESVLDPRIVLNLPKEYIEKQRERAKKIREFETYFNNPQNFQ